MRYFLQYFVLDDWMDLGSTNEKRHHLTWRIVLYPRIASPSIDIWIKASEAIVHQAKIHNLLQKITSKDVLIPTVEITKGPYPCRCELRENCTQLIIDDVQAPSNIRITYCRHTWVRGVHHSTRDFISNATTTYICFYMLRGNNILIQ